MDSTQVAVTAIAGIFGVVLGTVARPYFEEWFSRRKKTLHVVINEPSEFWAPHDSVVLSWHGETTRRIVQNGFRLENRTGRTLRNFRLEIGAKLIARDDQLHAVYLEESDRTRFTADDEGLRTHYFFEFFEPDATVSGSLLSNYSADLQVVALDDLELRRINPKGGTGWGRFVAGAVSTAGLVGISSAAAALISGN